MSPFFDMLRAPFRLAAIAIAMIIIVGGTGAFLPVYAQEQPETLAVQAQAYDVAQRHHLWRIAAWGGLNAVGGLALMAGSKRTTQPARWGFGVQAGAWGVINVGIAAVGLMALDAPPMQASALLDAERSLHDILLFNLGLNVAYSGVGAAMVAASYQGVDHARSWRGHGSALILQGAGLFVLDGIAFLAARSRLADLIGMTGDLSARATPFGVVLTLSIGG